MNTDAGLNAMVGHEPIPYDEFQRIMEDLHRAIGSASHIGEPTRNILLGRIEGYSRDHGGMEPSITRDARRDLIYAIKRAEGHSVNSTLSNEAAKEKCRHELASLLARPKRK